MKGGGAAAPEPKAEPTHGCGASQPLPRRPRRLRPRPFPRSPPSLPSPFFDRDRALVWLRPPRCRLPPAPGPRMPPLGAGAGAPGGRWPPTRGAGPASTPERSRKRRRDSRGTRWGRTAARRATAGEGRGRPEAMAGTIGAPETEEREIHHALAKHSGRTLERSANPSAPAQTRHRHLAPPPRLLHLRAPLPPARPRHLPSLPSSARPPRLHPSLPLVPRPLRRRHRAPRTPRPLRHRRCAPRVPRPLRRRRRAPRVPRLLPPSAPRGRPSWRACRRVGSPAPRR